MDSSEFFNALYAEHNLVGGVFVGNVQVLQHVAPEQLTDLVYDSSSSDVYFHTTTHDPDTMGARGKITTSVEIPALWCDLDLNHKDADYADVDAAASLIRQTEPNIIVSTGGGYHLYWLLDEPAPSQSNTTLAKDWIIYCNHLLSEAAGRNVKLDQTGDLARVLRVPGTMNSKHNVLVEAAWNPQVGSNRKPLSHYTTLLTEAGTRTHSSRTKRSSNSSISDSIMASMGNIGVQQEPAELSEIVSRCAQVRNVHELGGAVYEPLWYTALGLANYVRDPHAAAHALSHKHGEYDPVLTIEKMEQWKDAADGPPTCTKFMQENPQGCAGCPFNKYERGQGVSSPVQLGYMGETATSPTPEAVPLQVAAQIGTAQQVAATAEPDTIAPIGEAPASGHFLAGMGLEEGIKFARQFVIPPFSISNDGAVVLTVVNEDDVQQRVVLMPTGLLPVRHQNHSVDRRHDVQYTFATWNVWHKEWRLLDVPGAAFASPANMASHLNMSIQYTATAARIHGYMNACAVHISRAQEPEEVVSSYGWSDTSPGQPATFALGNTMYYRSGKTATTSMLDASAAADFGLQTMGSVEDWAKAVELLLAPQQMASHRVAFFAALGAPLLRFAPVAGGMISLYSTQSGTYKSFTTRLINSLYSRGDLVTIVQKNATINAQNSVLSTFNGLPTTFDEISEINSEEVRTLAYSVSDGRLKARLNQTGERRASKAWSTIMVCTTNRRLLDKISHNRAEAGAEAARLIELDVGGASGAISVDTVQEASRLLDDNSGLAGPMLAEFITEKQGGLKKLFDSQYLSLMRDMGDNSEARFWVSMCTCALVGARIAQSLGLVSSSLTDGLHELCISAMQEQVGQHESARVGVQELVTDFLSENIGKAVVLNRDRHPINRNQPREIWYSTSASSVQGERYVTVWQKQLMDHVQERGYNKAALRNDLITNGLLSEDPKHWNYPTGLYLRSPTNAIDWPSPPRPRCVTLKIDVSSIPELVHNTTDEE